jgi:uncharacterized protein YcnI
MNRLVLRASLIGAVSIAILLTSGGIAAAHVTVNAPDAKQGGFGVLTFRVPTESQKASTKSLKVILPAAQPLASVFVEPKAGWTYAVRKAKLTTPVNSDDGQVTEAVSEIDWTAVAGVGIKPGEFDEFTLSVGPLPTADAMVFKVFQHYSDGKDVAWIETPAPGTTDEPAHPAPTLKLIAAATTQATATGNGLVTPRTASYASKGSAITALVVGALGAALGACGLAVAVSFRRRSRMGDTALAGSVKPTMAEPLGRV